MKPPSKAPTATPAIKTPAAADAIPGLKLIALDHEDLVVLAAHLQDAVAVIGDMTFLPKERRFVALLNRFDWTIEPDPKTPGVRRRAALRIEQARRAQVQGIDLQAKGSVINVLTAVFEPDADAAKAPAGCLTLVCAGGAAIRLDVDCIEAQLEDLGPAWSAKAVPRHET
jgi:hypothetical protein